MTAEEKNGKEATPVEQPQAVDGGAPRQPTEEELAHFQEQMFEAQVQQTLAVVHPFVEGHTDVEQLDAFVRAALVEQSQIFESIWPSLFGQAAKDYPTLHIRVWGPEAESPKDEKHQVLLKAASRFAVQIPPPVRSTV
jgi:hypothetical protein